MIVATIDFITVIGSGVTTRVTRALLFMIIIQEKLLKCMILGDSWCFAGQTMDISDQRCNHQQTLSAHSAHSSSELLSENIEFKMILTLSTSFYLTTKLGKMDLFTIELNLVFEWSVKTKTDPPDVHPDHVSVVASKIHQKHLVANNHTWVLETQLLTTQPRKHSPGSRCSERGSWRRDATLGSISCEPFHSVAHWQWNS